MMEVHRKVLDWEPGVGGPKGVDVPFLVCGVQVRCLDLDRGQAVDRGGVGPPLSSGSGKHRMS